MAIRRTDRSTRKTLLALLAVAALALGPVTPGLAADEEAASNSETTISTEMAANEAPAESAANETSHQEDLIAAPVVPVSPPAPEQAPEPAFVPDPILAAPIQEQPASDAVEPAPEPAVVVPPASAQSAEQSLGSEGVALSTDEATAEPTFIVTTDAHETNDASGLGWLTVVQTNQQNGEQHDLVATIDGEAGAGRFVNSFDLTLSFQTYVEGDYGTLYVLCTVKPLTISIAYATGQHITTVPAAFSRGSYYPRQCSDTDSDNVSDFDDQCSDTPAGTIVDSNGCAVKPDPVEPDPVVTESVSATPSSIDEAFAAAIATCGADAVLTGAQFNITGASSLTSSIDVTLSDGTVMTVALSSTNGNVHKYDVALAPGVTIKSATATVPASWAGNFVMSHYKCGTAEEPNQLPQGLDPTDPNSYVPGQVVISDGYKLSGTLAAKGNLSRRATIDFSLSDTGGNSIPVPGGLFVSWGGVTPLVLDEVNLASYCGTTVSWAWTVTTFHTSSDSSNVSSARRVLFSGSLVVPACPPNPSDGNWTPSKNNRPGGWNGHAGGFGFFGPGDPRNSAENPAVVLGTGVVTGSGSGSTWQDSTGWNESSGSALLSTETVTAEALAETGVDSTPWILAGFGAFILAVGSCLLAFGVRHRKVTAQ